MIKVQSQKVIIVAVLLVILAVVIVSRPLNIQVPVQTQGSANSTSIEEVAAEHTRWEEMGAYYSRQAARHARWQEMGAYYSRQAAKHARWQEMGGFYSHQANNRPDSAATED